MWRVRRRQTSTPTPRPPTVGRRGCGCCSLVRSGDGFRDRVQASGGRGCQLAPSANRRRRAARRGPAMGGEAFIPAPKFAGRNNRRTQRGRASQAARREPAMGGEAFTTAGKFAGRGNRRTHRGRTGRGRASRGRDLRPVSVDTPETVLGAVGPVGRAEGGRKAAPGRTAEKDVVGVTTSFQRGPLARDVAAAKLAEEIQRIGAPIAPVSGKTLDESPSRSWR